MYRSLAFEKVKQTINKLTKRIEERFPDSGLVKVCCELATVANETESNVEWIARPNLKLRLGIGVVIALGLALLFFMGRSVDIKEDELWFRELLPIVESVVNTLILAGLALLFLANLEVRIKRGKAVASLNELRTIAHVIDMHQLTKDPTEQGRSRHATPSSPTRELTSYELTRYLNYCGEMLSLIGKIAAVYAEHLPDPQVNTAVNELESLCTGLSRKIWQKIMIVQAVLTEQPDPFEVP